MSCEMKRRDANIQSVTTILDVSSNLVNWLVEPMLIVLDIFVSSTK